MYLNQFFVLDIKKEVSVLSKKEHKLKSEEIELEEQLKNFNAAIDEYKENIHQWKARVNSQANRMLKNIWLAVVLA